MTFPSPRIELPSTQLSAQTSSYPNEKGYARRNLLMRVAIGGMTIAVSIADYFSYQVVRNLMLRNLKHNAFLEVQQGTVQIDRWLGTHMGQVETIANTKDLRSLDWAIVQPYLQAEAKRVEDFIAFSMVEPDGYLYNNKVGKSNTNIKDRSSC